MGADNHMTTDVFENMTTEKQLKELEEKYGRETNKITAERAKKRAKSATKYNLCELVGDEVNDWSKEKTTKEVWKSAEIIVSESRRNHPEIWETIHDRAITLVIEDMPRVPMNHMATNNIIEVVWSHGYRPNSMNKWTIWGMIAYDFEENPHQYNAYLVKATKDVKDGIVEKLTDY